MHQKLLFLLFKLLFPQKRVIGITLIFSLALIQSASIPTVFADGPATNTHAPASTSQALITVDHNSIALFDQIPDQYIQAAANLNMLFIDRSVGGNINDGLDCLAYESDEAAPAHCKRYEHVDPRYSVDPSEVNWYRAGGYNRSNWDFLFWSGAGGLPSSITDPNGGCSSWNQKNDCYLDYMNSGIINQYDVTSYQFSYLMVTEGSNISDEPGGFFSDNASLSDVYDLEAFEAQHTDKTSIYWTTSLARPIGTSESETFNNQMRQYASDNNKILFDVADILSHDPDGNPCYDSRDGVLYDNGNTSENYPDDGQNLAAICQHYTTEVDGGHLGNISAGKIRVAKGFWVLMAQIAGWSPGNTPVPPRVLPVSPANGASAVAIDEPLVVNFSEAMNTSSVSYTLNPNPGIIPSWNSGGTQLTLNHNDFEYSTPYALTITGGTDLDGNSLENSPYASSFTTDGPYADLSVTAQVDDIYALPGSPINVTLTVANAGPVFPVTATVVDQWSQLAAVSAVTNLPANCHAATGGTGQLTGSITCSNINLTAGAPSVSYHFVMQTSASFSGPWYNQATVTANDTSINDAGGNNIGLFIMHPFQVFLPLILK